MIRGNALEIGKLSNYYKSCLQTAKLSHGQHVVPISHVRWHIHGSGQAEFRALADFLVLCHLEFCSESSLVKPGFNTELCIFPLGLMASHGHPGRLRSQAERNGRLFQSQNVREFVKTNMRRSSRKKTSDSVPFSLPPCRVIPVVRNCLSLIVFLFQLP